MASEEEIQRMIKEAREEGRKDGRKEGRKEGRMTSGRYAEAMSLQPWLDKLETLSLQMQVAATSGNNRQGHVDECHAHSSVEKHIFTGESRIQYHSPMARTGAAATEWQCNDSVLFLPESFRKELTRLWLNIALQSL
jgi:hypothetical protein